MKVLYIYSGKGGVGKTSVCTNLAFSFKHKGLKVGLFDADLTSPSIPTMVHSVEELPQKMDKISVVPGVYGGVKISSLGFNNKVIDSSYWTDRYLKGALYQLFFSVNWDVDILMIDLPPGTNNIHQELFTKLPGKVLIVTTPQEVSYVDVKRSIDFMNRLNIDILGVVENMSYFYCDTCGNKKKIFLGDTIKELCKPFSLELLSSLPIMPEMNKSLNEGIPYFYEKEPCKEYIELVNSLLNRFDEKSYIKRMN